MSTSPHRHRKGCPLCKPHKIQGRYGSHRNAWRVIKQYGTKRKFGRRPAVET